MLDDVTKGYLKTALWCEGYDHNELDKFSEEAIKKATKFCSRFMISNKQYISQIDYKSKWGIKKGCRTKNFH